jgi:GNAT superfamily N-acetyltransferase
LPEAAFEEKVRRREAYVLLADDIPAGLLRYGLFWDNTPFCNLLFIDEAYRRRGFGTALMARWEADMRALGYDTVLTSTQADESAQHFYRKLGYRDCGGLVMEDGGPMELILRKATHSQTTEVFP